MRRLLVFLVVMVAGCSRSGSQKPVAGSGSGSAGEAPATPAATASKVDPCKILSKAELQATTGLTLQDGNGSDGPYGAKVCNFWGTASPAGLARGVTIIAGDGTVFDQIASNFERHDPQGMFITNKVTGIGELAFSQQARNGRSDTQTLVTFAQKGERITIKVQDDQVTVQKLLSIDIALAGAAAARL